MFKFIERWRRERPDQQFRNGYDWAAGILLRGGRVDEITDYTNAFVNAFDLGATKAVFDWIRRFGQWPS